MIAWAGYEKYRLGLTNLTAALPRWPLEGYYMNNILVLVPVRGALP